MRKSWISLLERSLANQARIELGLEQRFDALALDYETPERPRQPLPKGTKVSEKFFDRLGVGRSLLILGTPGSGKTTTLLELARDLIDRVENEGYFPLPVTLNLSSWAVKQESLDQWILQELGNSPYSVPKKLAKDWLKEQQLILLLDGLDEVKVEVRNACITAINKFKQTYGQTDLIVCSRITDYENLTNRLQFQAAIFIQPLTQIQIEEYLNQAGNSLAGVKQALQTDVVLQEMVQAPLMLSVIALAYEGFSSEALPQMPFKERQKHLWNKYVQRMLERRKSKHYSDEQTVHWLKFLTQRMVEGAQSIFLIEWIQPTWLGLKARKKSYESKTFLFASLTLSCFFGLLLAQFFTINIYVLQVNAFTSKAIFGLLLGFIFWFPVWFLAGLFSDFKSWLLDEVQLIETINFSFVKAKNTLVAFLFVGLFLGFIAGLIAELQFWLSNSFQSKLFRYEVGFLLLISAFTYFLLCLIDWLTEETKSTSTLKSSFQKTDSILRTPALCIGMLYFIAIDSGEFKLIHGLIAGLIGGLLFGLIGGLGLGFTLTESKIKKYPNQGIRKSAINSGLYGLASGLLTGLLFKLIKMEYSLLYGLNIGLWVSLSFGGAACIRHLNVRFKLWQKGFAPWNYARFLDDCYDRLLLQKVGGGYIFMHRLLMEHFAQLELEDQRR